MVNHTQDFVAVKKYEILQYSLIPIVNNVKSRDPIGSKNNPSRLLEMSPCSPTDIECTIKTCLWIVHHYLQRRFRDKLFMKQFS